MSASDHLSPAQFSGQHVTHYVNWASKNGHDSDSVSGLKAYEKSGGVSRKHANYIADQLYIGGGEPNWRSQRD